MADDSRCLANGSAEDQYVYGFDQCAFAEHRIAVRVAADDMQAHAFFKETTQPASVSALAADEADPWFVVDHARKFCSGFVCMTPLVPQCTYLAGRHSHKGGYAGKV